MTLLDFPRGRIVAAGVAAAFLSVPALPASAQSIPAPAAKPAPVAALRMAATAPSTRRFYARTGWQPAWNPAAERELMQILAGRAAHGLDGLDFFRDPGASAPAAARDVALTDAALRYAAALGAGAVDPARLHDVYTLARPQLDAVAGLATALAHGEVHAWFSRLAPQYAGYAKLSEAYRAARAEQAAEAGRVPRIAPSGLIHAGDRDPRVPAIARQLVAEGYGVLPETAGFPNGAAEAGDAAEPPVFTEAMAEAVRQMQRDYGLVEDGVIGPRTIAVLNLRPADRARALAVALERLRWLARNPPATRIDVNIAAARLRYYRDGVLVDSRTVVVGKPGTETPMLSSPLYRLVANPTWTIPKSIERSELAHAGAAYLASRNMVRRNGYIVQQPGPDNALGLVKFDMVNDQAIYLHDTSAPALFARSERHLSHGCVRVEDALGFARRIADDEGVADRWQAASAGGDQAFVDLPTRIPVRLLYQNAFVDEAGQVVVRTDPYGWNGPVARALGLGDGTRTRSRPAPVDIGP